MDDVNPAKQPDDSVIRFSCAECGQHISVPIIHAGKKGKCPKCKSTVVIPGRENAGIDSLLPGPAPKNNAKAQPASSTGLAEDVRKLEEKLNIAKKIESPPKRKFPFLFDIFLYPANIEGLTILGIVIGIPLLFHIFMKFLFLFAIVFPPAWVLLMLFGAISFIANIVLLFYFYWYLAECVRSSAGGAIRTPETMAITPGPWELLVQTAKVFACLVFFSAPALIYISWTIWKSNLEWTSTLASMRNDPALWLWVSYGIFFFPMGLLAVVMFDSINGLNPILFIGSLYSMFLPYCGLILAFYAFGYLIIKINQLSAVIPFLPQVWSYASRIITYYLLMVMAHLLGRFYWRYQEKLNWDV